jgi:hypothetical protein
VSTLCRFSVNQHTSGLTVIRLRQGLDRRSGESAIHG